MINQCMYDLHVHSNYSDGGFLKTMVETARTTGLDGIGFADHCYVSDRDLFQNQRSKVGMNLDLTYKRRRHGIEIIRTETDFTIYDAVEMDYDPRDREMIEEFLTYGNFDYTIGSVHRIRDLNIQSEDQFSSYSDSKLDSIVDEYYEILVNLIKSELFNIAAHIDLPERTNSLRGRASEEHYHQVASAFSRSKTIPEINVGRALSDTGVVHPGPSFLDILLEYDITFTVGSDAHDSAQLVDRVPFLMEFFETNNLNPVNPPQFD